MNTRRLPSLLPILFVVSLLSACAHVGPKVNVCISDPPMDGMDCYSEITNRSYFKTYIETDKYVCLPPEDAHTVFDFCAQAAKKAGMK